MNKKKKVLLSLMSLAVAATLVVGSAFAYFIVYDTAESGGNVGSVRLEVSPITVGHNEVFQTITNGGIVRESVNSSTSSANIKKDLTDIKLTTYSYGASSGPYNTFPSPCDYWVFASGSSAGLSFNSEYFRTDDGDVAYCVDFGLNATDADFDSTGYSKGIPGTTILNETTPVSDDVKRVLKVGFPNVKYGDVDVYDNPIYENAHSNEELEWATAVALYIAEGDAYHHDGSEWIEGQLRLDKMSIDNLDGDAFLIPYALYDPFDDEELQAADIAVSARLKQLVADILERADHVINVPNFYINVNDVFNDQQYDSNGVLTGYLVGPFVLEDNIGTAGLTLVDTDGNEIDPSRGIHFRDQAGNAITEFVLKDQFTTYPFYVYVPKEEKNTDIRVIAKITGFSYITPEEYSSFPMYYYWDGDPTHQKMVSCGYSVPTASVTISKSMYDNYTYWNPGDILTVKWTVKNAGNKSVVTRNIVSIYLENNDMSQYANQKDIVYLYPEETDASEIFADQFPSVRSELYSTDAETKAAAQLRDFRKDPTLYMTATKIDACSYKKGSLESMGTVVVNGKTYKAGYSFIVYGDALDGVGVGAEVGNAYEVDYASQFDETLNNLDEVSFKMCLASAANVHTMGEKLIIRVETQAMQYRNTSDAEWNELFRNSYKDAYGNYPAADAKWDSYWKTVAVNEYVIGTGENKPNNPLDNTPGQPNYNIGGN